MRKHQLVSYAETTTCWYFVFLLVFRIFLRRAGCQKRNSAASAGSGRERELTSRHRRRYDAADYIIYIFSFPYCQSGRVALCARQSLLCVDLKHAADEYLKECFSKKTQPHVNELAARLHLPVPRLSNMFKRVVGQRPSDYLKRRQVDCAKQLIRSTTWDYDSIAKASGFGTRTTLFRSFRRITHRTPNSFRRSR